MAEPIQQTIDCKETRAESDNRIHQKVKTWVLHIKYDDGVGWAIVNAPTVSLAQGIFLRQTRFVNPKILDLKELKFFGEEWQLCYEDGVGKPRLV